MGLNLLLFTLGITVEQNMPYIILDIFLVFLHSQRSKISFEFAGPTYGMLAFMQNCPTG